MPKRLTHGPKIGEMSDAELAALGEQLDARQRSAVGRLAEEPLLLLERYVQDVARRIRDAFCVCLSVYVKGRIERSDDGGYIWTVPAGTLGDDQPMALTPSGSLSEILFYVTRLGGWKRPGRGRPRGSGTFRDAAEFRKTMRTAIQDIRKRGREPTQETLAEYFASRSGPVSENCDARQIRRWCTDYGVPWEELVADD